MYPYPTKLNNLKIHFLNVGDGDCTIIELPDGKIMVIDISNGYGNFDKENPILYLKHKRISEIYRYIQTHPEMDHMEGLAKLRSEFKILNFWDTENNRPQPDFSSPYTVGKPEDWKAYQELRKKSLYIYRGREIDRDRAEQVYLYKIYVLHPTKEIVKKINVSPSPKWNNLSYVFVLEYKYFKLLYCGDPEEEVWEDLYNWVTNYRKEDWLRNIDVFKVSHHGRRSGYCGAKILNLAEPQLIVISKGSVDPEDYAYSNYYQFLKDKEKIFITSQGTISVEYDDEIRGYYSVNQGKIRRSFRINKS
jgi:beta-lactamase superfamily II metal-dependent hydrolase